jgi:hypothetical protein
MYSRLAAVVDAPLISVPLPKLASANDNITTSKLQRVLEVPMR